MPCSRTCHFYSLYIYTAENLFFTKVVGIIVNHHNEKDASTFDLTVRPLSGAVNTGLLLNSDGGAREKTSRNLEKNTLFNCHFMSLNWPIFGIFPSSPASPSPGLYCHTNISLCSSATHVQRSPQCLSFCFIKINYLPFSQPAREEHGSHFLAVF
jgi:hypothetical protein